MENLDTGGPTGGPNMLGAAEGGGLMEEARGGKEWEAEGGKGELVVKGEESVDAGANWEEWERGAARGLLRAGSSGTLGREEETEGEVIVPGTDSGLDRPATQSRKVILIWSHQVNE